MFLTHSSEEHVFYTNVDGKELISKQVWGKNCNRTPFPAIHLLQPNSPSSQHSGSLWASRDKCILSGIHLETLQSLQVSIQPLLLPHIVIHQVLSTLPPGRSLRLLITPSFTIALQEVIFCNWKINTSCFSFWIFTASHWIKQRWAFGVEFKVLHIQSHCSSPLKISLPPHLAHPHEFACQPLKILYAFPHLRLCFNPISKYASSSMLVSWCFILHSRPGEKSLILKKFFLTLLVINSIFFSVWLQFFEH